MGCSSCFSFEMNWSHHGEWFEILLWVWNAYVTCFILKIFHSNKSYLLFKCFWMDGRLEELEVWIVEWVLIDLMGCKNVQNFMRKIENVVSFIREWKREGAKKFQEECSLCTRRVQVGACSLERTQGSLERTSFCLWRTMPETCPLERNLGELERTSFWMRPLEWT